MVEYGKYRFKSKEKPKYVKMEKKKHLLLSLKKEQIIEA